LANGIGVTIPGLDLIADHLRSRHRVISWDYRGIGTSRIERAALDLSIGRHAADALCILTALGGPGAVVLGWSMGVQLGLEIIRQAPERVAGFGALFGSPAKPFRAGFSDPVAMAIELNFLFSLLFPWPAQAMLAIGAAIPSLAWRICTLSGFVGQRAHRELFHRNVCSVARADKSAYFGTMVHLVEHDARDVLPHVRCPVLIVAGSDDRVTPPHAAEEMASQLSDAQLVVLPNTSHFGVIEQTSALWKPIDQLLERSRIYARGSRREVRDTSGG
jgi:pimeloyl-ACP methyl ester carboxylesterase